MSRGEDIPDTTKQEAAELAVLHSSQNGGAKVAVDTTEVKIYGRPTGRNRAWCCMRSTRRST